MKWEFRNNHSSYSKPREKATGSCQQPVFLQVAVAVRTTSATCLPLLYLGMSWLP